MRNTIQTGILMLVLPLSASAQFYTITKDAELTHESALKRAERVEFAKDTATLRANLDSAAVQPAQEYDKRSVAQKGYSCTSQGTRGERKHLGAVQTHPSVSPELTIPNLYDEIIRNRIQYPKIVLAQAILETGWFKSSVCKYKHNLFGLTNPRTGKYYEFEHWTESVRAYYTKVQYRYKGGNYLLWLRDIGYAENPNYVREVIRVLKML